MEVDVRLFYVTGGEHNALYVPHFIGIARREQSFPKKGRLKRISPRVSNVALFAASLAAALSFFDFLTIDSDTRKICDLFFTDS